MVDLLRASLFGLLVSILVWVKPSVLDPVIWTSQNPLPALEVNHKLRSCHHEMNGIALGPESMAFDSNDGKVYLSLSNGRVISAFQNGTYASDIFFTGDHVQVDNFDYIGLGINSKEDLKNWCHRESLMKRLAWNEAGERACGRPLGLRLFRDHLYLLDAYHGGFKVNIHTKSVKHLFTSNTQILAPEGSDPLVTLPPKFFNDLDITSDETIIYFSDSSFKHTRSGNRQEILDGAPRGRIFKFSLVTETLTVLLCGLHFPNGVQLLSPSTSSSSSFLFKSDPHILLVGELARFRVLRVNVDSLNSSYVASCSENGFLASALQANETQAPVSVFMDSVPGLVDNIRRDVASSASDPKFLIGLGSKSSKPFSLLWYGLQTGFLRTLVGKFVPMKLVEHLVPRYGLVLAVSQRGEIIETFQDPGGKVVSMISECQRHPKTGDLWFGSHSNTNVAILAKPN